MLPFGPPQKVCGYALDPEKLRNYAKEHGLDSIADAATDIAYELKLYPRVRVMYARGRKRDPFPCLVVGTNLPNDNLPAITPEQLQTVKDFFKTKREPRWYLKG